MLLSTPVFLAVGGGFWSPAVNSGHADIPAGTSTIDIGRVFFTEYDHVLLTGACCVSA